jgi:potassium efflux system protein
LNALLKILLLALTIGGMDAAPAQETPEPNQLSQELVSARIQTLRDAGGQEGSETPINNYEQVLNWLGEAEAHAAAEATYLGSLTTAPQFESEIRARMDTVDYAVPGMDPASVSQLGKSKIEEKLTELRVELRDTITNKDNLDRRVATEQSSAPNIQARIEAIDSRIQELPADVITIEPGIQPSQFEASQWSVLAERKALVAERRSLEARLSSQPVRYSRRKAESDEFKLVIDGLQLAVQTLEAELAARAENLETEASVSLDENAPGYEYVQRLADENTQFRSQRTKLDSALSALKDENAQVDQTQHSLGEQYEAVQQIVALAQNSSSLGHVLMAHWHQADSFRMNLAELDSARDIGEHVIQRAEYQELQGILLKTTLEDEMGPDTDEAMLAAAKDRVRTQRELLTELIAMETELINLQGNIDRTHQQLGVKYEAYQRYLRSRILWVPSHPPISFPSRENVSREFAGFVDSLSGLRLGHFTPATGLFVILILTSLMLRKNMNSYMQRLNAKVGRVRDDSIRYTFRALLFTLIRSIAVPLLLVVFANSLQDSGTAAAPYLSAAFIHAAEMLFIILLLRTACDEDGIARVHFGWSMHSCMDIRRLATSLLVWWWPVRLATAFVFKVEVNSFSAVFGRTLFCLSLVILGIVLLRFLWPERSPKEESRPWRKIAIVLVISAVTVFTLASIFGYLYSAKIIYDALMASLLIGIGLIFFYYFMQRWLLLVRRKLRFRELLDARQSQDDRQEHAVESEENNLVTLSESVSQLLKAGTLTLGILGIAFVWAPLFQALEAMQRITLWTISDMSEGEAILTSITLASLALALLIGVITYIAARYVPQLLSLLLRSRKGTTPGSRYAISKLLGYFIVGVGIIAFLSTMGLRWDRLQWLVAALGVGIGFGLQEIIANFISGLLILFERPIRVGDVITVGESSGQVIRIQIRATTIRDFDGKELLVPNKEFVTGRLLNWTLSNTDIRMTLEVGIAYGSDVRKAVAILEELLKNHDMILDSPAPDVIFREFGNSSLNLIARYFFSDVEQRGVLLSDLHMKINDAFSEAGIVIAFPQIDVHLDKGVTDLPGGEKPLPGSA